MDEDEDSANDNFEQGDELIEKLDEHGRSVINHNSSIGSLGIDIRESSPSPVSFIGIYIFRKLPIEFNLVVSLA